MEKQTGVIVEHVYKSFGKEHVLKDVNLTILPGQIYGIVGNNGSGKTAVSYTHLDVYKRQGLYR